MTGEVAHYEEAERLLARANETVKVPGWGGAGEGSAYRLGADMRAELIAQAQVHATLALVQAQSDEVAR